jgi:PKHD-type hydroxylase
LLPGAVKTQAMLITLADVLEAGELAALRADLEAASWVDGEQSAGRQARAVKHNRQIARTDPLNTRWAQPLGQALGRCKPFMRAARPLHTLPPLFSRYGAGESYGLHVDNALRTAGGLNLRADLAATLFLSDPDSYDGGELSVETRFGAQRVKLPAGHMVLYPASSRHQVMPVTRGCRLAAIFWIQSLIRNDANRELLFDLDEATRSLGDEIGRNDPRVLVLSATVQNLLRRWAET